jgi:enamine deaminase RidA (YjgF/YER057c/UK114 family)
MTHPEEKLKELGIELKDVKPFHPAVAVGVITEGNLLYVSGSTSPSYIGRVGDTVSVEDGYKAAREAAIAQIAAAKSVLGDLGRVKRVVKVLGMVNAAPGFKDTPAVIHGASEFYFEVFGEKGIHTRSAVGLQALPSEVAVEVETIFEVDPA